MLLDTQFKFLNMTKLLMINIVYPKHTHQHQSKALHVAAEQVVPSLNAHNLIPAIPIP